MKHVIKSWPEYFEPVLDGSKKFELRLNDRGFKVGDVITLREWDPHKKTYSGREMTKLVMFMMGPDEFIGGLMPGYVIMSLGDWPTRFHREDEDT